MKLASIEIISDLKPHPNADRLELATVLGWQTVVKKEQFKPGDKVIFITIDTIVPLKPWSEFLADKDNPNKSIRIKNIKLRGEYSSGLVLPLSEFPDQFTETVVIGEDVTQLLGITKYIKEIPAHLAGETIGDFPTHLASKTDEDNGLNDPDLVNQVIRSGGKITVTQKIDGSSITVVVKDGYIDQVCSRNLSKKDTENSAFWNAAKKLHIPQGWSGIIQGELAGNGIQKNPLKLEGIEIFVFQIYKDSKYYLTYGEMKMFCESELKCKVVPLVEIIDTWFLVEHFDNPLQKLQSIADSQVYSSGLPAEGIVVRPSHYPKSFNSRRPLGFKLINRNYKD